MKATRLLSCLTFVALFGFTSCSTDNIEEKIDAKQLPAAPIAKQIEIEAMELINAYRVSQGLSLLNKNNTVKAVAFTHTEYMVEVDNVSHDNFYQRKESLQVNANANKVSENVAYGFNSAQSLVNAWLDSSSHRENIEGNYTHFDISAEQNSEGRWYFTNIFINK